MVQEKITTPQFFVTMFVSRIVFTMGLNANSLGGENMLEAIFSYVLAMFFGLLISVPVWLLVKKYPGLPVGEAAVRAMNGVGKLVPALYLLYFVFLNAASLGMFHLFVLDTVNPDFSAALAMAAVLAVAVYGAYRGIETIVRCAACVFAILLISAGLVFGIVATRFDPENLMPLFAQGPGQTLNGMWLFLARTSVFADMAVLLPFVKGKKERGFLGWAGGTTVFIGVLLLLLAGCLGPYAATQNFPVYVLSSITEVRSLQRLDAVFVGVWMMGLVVKAACDLYACRICLFTLCGGRVKKYSVIPVGVLILLLAFLMVEFQSVQNLFTDTRLLLCGALTTGAALPLLVLLFGALRGKKGERS